VPRTDLGPCVKFQPNLFSSFRDVSQSIFGPKGAIQIRYYYYYYYHKVNMDLFICIAAHPREAPLMHYHFPYVGADLRKLVHQPGIQQTLRDHGYGLVYHAMCLFTSPAFARYSFPPDMEGELRLSRPGCLVLHQAGLPVKRRSPTRALTGPSVE